MFIKSPLHSEIVCVYETNTSEQILSAFLVSVANNIHELVKLVKQNMTSTMLGAYDSNSSTKVDFNNNLRLLHNASMITFGVRKNTSR